MCELYAALVTVPQHRIGDKMIEFVAEPGLDRGALRRQRCNGHHDGRTDGRHPDQGRLWDTRQGTIGPGHSPVMPDNGEEIPNAAEAPGQEGPPPVPQHDGVGATATPWTSDQKPVHTSDQADRLTPSTCQRTIQDRSGANRAPARAILPTDGRSDSVATLTGLA
jgi:hypothetical protein